MIDYIAQITPFILDGFLVTLALLASTTLLSIPLGLLFSVIRFYAYRPIKVIIDGFTALIRGTPLLLQLFFVMYGLPMIGIVFGRMEVAIITFAINYSAYYIEIFRSAISTIDETQFDAAKVLGLTNFQTMKSIILPQAIKRSLPIIANETITLLKDTALVSSIAVADMLRNAREIVARDLQIEAFAVVALIYLFATYCMIFIFRMLEKKWEYFH